MTADGPSGPPRFHGSFGGSHRMPEEPDRTRRGHVTRHCPIDREPPYPAGAPDPRKRPTATGGWICEPRA